MSNYDEYRLEEDNMKRDKEDKAKKKSEIKVWKCILSVSFIIISVMLIYLLNWSRYMFGEIPFSQILFHIMVPLEGADSSIITSYFSGVVKWVLLAGCLMAIMGDGYYLGNKYKEKIKNKVINILLIVNRFLLKRMLLISSIILVIVITVDVYGFGIDTWIEGRINSSTIFEEYYVDSGDAKIKAPKKKKNLIFVLSESLEATYTDFDNGGCMDQNYLPNLTELAKENTHFSRNESLAGAVEVEGTGWTIAAMVAQMSGVPLMLPVGNNAYGAYDEFLPGVTSLGDILEENGYVNEIIIGSQKEFAGVDTFFEQHGNYIIYDYFTAVKDGYVSNHNGFWGVDDKDLLKIAKDEIKELAAGDKPFNIVVNTIDLHTPNGYICSNCKSTHDDDYKNIIECQDRLIAEFVEWCQEQDFYEDTVIVVAGDHLSMAPVVKNEYVPDKYQRSVYHAIINSDLEPVNSTNRLFTTMDMFPTILASLGFDIEGERLGLGTNLYSSKKTVMETIGKKKFKDEMSRNSKLYNKEILGTR